MAGDQSRVVEAFIEIKARKAADFDSDAKRMGREAGKEFERAFSKEADKDSPAAKAKRVRKGKEIGDQIGDAAGKEAGAKTSKGITDGLAKSRVQREKDGEEFGRILGAKAGDRASKEIVARFRHNRRGFLREGEQAGEAFGNGATSTLRSRILVGVGGTTAVLRARFKIAGRRTGTATADAISDALRASTPRFARDGARIGDAAGAAAGRHAAAATRASMKAEAVAEAGEAAKAAKAAKQASADFEARIKKIQKVASVGLKGIFAVAGIGALAASASGLGTVIAGTVTAVTQLSGVLGILPGAMAAAGIGALALKVGLHDVGTALSDSGDPKKYAEDLKKLAPAAQGFVKALVKLKPELKSLRNSVQQGLFKGAGKEITDLGARYLPILKRGLTETSQAFARGRSSVAAYLDKAKTAKLVTGILDDTSVSAGRLSRSFRPVVSSFLDIASVGTSFLPKLADKLSTVAERFAAFTAKTRQSGAMKEFFQGGIDAVGDLGKALGGAGRIIGGLFKASGAASSSPLETFAGILNKIGDTVNKPAFQAGLSHFFDAIATAGDGVGEKMTQLGDALVALEPTISRLIATGGVALPSVLESIASAAQSLAPTLEFLSKGFAALAPHAGPLLLALVGIKGALFAFKGVKGAVDGISAFITKFDQLGVSGRHADGRITELRRNLGKFAKGGAVVGVAALARFLGDLSGKANVASVDVDKLASSLRSLGKGGALGGEGLKLFSTAGVFGLVKNQADTSAEALKRFGTSAFNALDQGWDARLGRWQSFGQAEATFKKQTEQLDGAFAQMAKNGHLGTASAAFEKFIQAGVDAGVPVASLKAAFPQFGAAIAASGGAVDNTTGKVRNLTVSLSALISKTDEYAGKTLDARGAARNYQAALDAASEALKRNGGSLDITTAKGRENQASLDAIAEAGIAAAKTFAGDGPNAQARFRDALLQTRRDLIKTGKHFQGGKEAAKQYADSILHIPSKASTRISTPGIDRAVARLGNLIVQVNKINGKVFRFTVLEVFQSLGKQDDAMARRGHMAGGQIQRRAFGGLLDPKLGGPRQDNVYIGANTMASGGEFVMNAFATAQPGVLALLRKINASNQYPQQLATGGQVRRASMGFGDLTASAPARIERTTSVHQAPPPVASSGVSREDLDYFTARIERAMSGLTVRLNDGALAGAVEREGGRRW